MDYFFECNLDSLVGKVDEYNVDPLMIELSSESAKVIKGYRNINGNVDLEVLKNNLSSVLCSILILKKWEVGLAIFSKVIDQTVTTDELLLIERMFSHRFVPKDKSIFLSTLGKVSVANYLPVFLKSSLSKLGIIVTSKDIDIVSSMYSFSILSAENLSLADKLGIMSRSLRYLEISSNELKNFEKRKIEMSIKDDLFVENYSGGIISSGIPDIDTYTSLQIVLIVIRSLSRSVLNKTIDLIPKISPITKRYKINNIFSSLKEKVVLRLRHKNKSTQDVEELLENIASLNMLITPNTLTDAYQFNSEILPAFLRATNIDNVRDNLENMLRIFQETIEKQRNRTLNSVLIVLTLLTVLIAIFQLLIYFLPHK